MRCETTFNATLNYYEIVQGGMREDAKAFADREDHDAERRDDRGHAGGFAGGRYVKTFNNDKVKNDIEITVKLGRGKIVHPVRQTHPATVLVEGDFTNTGDEIGVDEGVYCVKVCGIRAIILALDPG